MPWLTGLNLVWEFAQLPLYAIGSDVPVPYIEYYVMHCTVGDMLIGAGSIVLALLMLQVRRLREWRWPRIVALTVLFGVTYTGFSEWMNTVVEESWQYAERMPTLALGGFKLGLSPIAQWLLVPPIALHLARFAFHSTRSGPR